jgi:hypothetical protein
LQNTPGCGGCESWRCGGYANRQQGIGSLDRACSGDDIKAREHTPFRAKGVANSFGGSYGLLEDPDRGSGAPRKGAIAALETDPDAELPSE